MPEQLSVHRKLFDYYEKRALALAKDRADNTKPGHLIKFSWIDDNRLNASASIEGCDNISITKGSVIILSNYFNYVNSRIKKINRQEIPGRSISPVLNIENVDSMLTNLYSNGEIIPNNSDPSRNALSQLMFRSAMDFIIHHEVAHIWNGHVDLLKIKAGLSFMEELFVNKNGGLSGIDFQTFELDADGYAVANVINSSLFEMVTDEFPEGYLIRDIEALHGCGASRVAIAFCAIYTIFKLFGESSWSIDGVDRDSHPPSQVRAAYNLGTAIEFLRERTDFHRPEELIISGFRLAESLFQIAIGNTKPFSFMFYLEEYMPYTRELLKNWRLLRPELDKLKRGGNLPMAQEDI